MFHQLPDEIVEEIAWYLDAKSLDSLERTCKRIKNIQFGRHWERIFISTLPGMDYLLYSTSSMKSLICTRQNVTKVKKEIIDLKRYVDIGEWCEFINWTSLGLTLQAATVPLFMLCYTPILIAQIREFYERKRNTPPDATAI